MTHDEMTQIVTTDLRRARELAGLTQHELADRLGGTLSRSYIAMIETNSRALPAECVSLVVTELVRAHRRRLEFQQQARGLMAKLYPFTEADREAVAAERQRRERLLERRNELEVLEGLNADS